MKLLIITQTVDEGDPVLGFFVSWIVEFSKQVEQVEVICLKLGRSDLPKNVRVHSLGKEDPPRTFFISWRRAVYVFRFLRLAWRLRREYDAVFVHMNPEYVVLAGILWRALGKRVALWYTHRSVDLKLRIAAVLTNVIVTASAESFRLPSTKVRVIGHGIDMTQFVPPPKKPTGTTLRVLTIGRLSSTKRIMEMLAAIDTLVARDVSIAFTIAGVPATVADAAYERQVHAMIFAKPTASHVQFLGAVSHADIPALLERHDVFLNLSTTGSLDKAMLEALAAGMPAVTTNIAFRDLLAPVPGLFVETDSSTAIADALSLAAHADVTSITATIRAQFALPHTIHEVCRLLAA